MIFRKLPNEILDQLQMGTKNKLTYSSSKNDNSNNLLILMSLQTCMIFFYSQKLNLWILKCPLPLSSFQKWN